MACGVRLAILAVVATAAHFIVVCAYPRLAASLPRSRYVGCGVRVVYEDGRGILREIISDSAHLGFFVARVQTQQLEHDVRGLPAVAVALELQGQPAVEQMVLDLNHLDGVLEVSSTDLVRGGD